VLIAALFFLFFGRIIFLFGFVISAAYIQTGEKGVIKNYTGQEWPFISVLISSRNNGRNIYSTIQSICESGYENSRMEVLVCDDLSTDDTSFWIKKAALDFQYVRSFKNNYNLGKLFSIRRISQYAKGELFVTIDADSYIDHGSLQRLIEGFESPNVGAIGGRIAVKNHSSSLLTNFQISLYVNTFFIRRALESKLGNTQCISGAFFGIRKYVYEKIWADIKTTHYVGGYFDVFGEDRFLTYKTLTLGYDTKINNNAICYTQVPNTLFGFFKQQLRWHKGAWRINYIILANIMGVIKLGAIRSLLLTLPCFLWILRVSVIAFILLSNNFYDSLFLTLLFSILLSPTYILAAYFFVFDRELERPYSSLNFFLAIMVIGPLWYLFDALVVIPFALFSLDVPNSVARN